MNRVRGIILGMVVVVLCMVYTHPALAYVSWGQCKVLSGESAILANNSSAAVTLPGSLPDITKAFVLVTATGQTGDVNANAHMATGYLSSTNTVTVERVGTPSTSLPFTYQVIFCGNNEFTVQTGTITIGSGSASGTATISSVDTSKSFVIISSRSPDTTADETTGLVYGYLSDATTVTVQRAASSTITPTVRYQVVTFSAESNVSVQTGNINLASSAASATATISSVNQSRTWLYCSWNSTNNTLRATSVGCDLTNTTTVTANRHVATSYTNAVQYSTIEFPAAAINIQRGIVVNNDPTNDATTRYDHDITITPVTLFNRAFPYVTQTVNGTGTAYPRNQWMYQLTTSSNLRGSFFNGDSVGNGDQNSKYWQVVEFLLLPPPALQSITMQSVNPTITIASYPGPATHTSTSWKVVDANNCKSGVSVWESLNNASALTSVTVNTTNGTFMNARSGQTTLAKDTGYYVCTMYNTTGGSSDWSPATFFSTDVLPVASSADMLSGAPLVNPVENGTVTIDGTVTVTDEDSCSDITSVNGLFFQTSLGGLGAPDGGYRYTTACTLNAGTCTGGSDTTALYTCSFPLQYYAHPTDPSSQQPSDIWTFAGAPVDEMGTGTVSNDTIEVGTLSALDVNPVLDFGSLGLGADTGGTNQTMAIVNTGNSRLDIELSGYGNTPGDGVGFQCARGAIPINLVKYFINTFIYNSGGNTLSGTPNEIDLDLMPVGLGVSTKNMYTGIKIPNSGIEGSCAGHISLTALYDSAND